MNAKLKKLFQQKVNGKTIIVTGASSGIGLTVSKYLAQATSILMKSSS
jgi:NAD(P)-dependent dehydrogenase (short-subunit alcohol dehydrogenase family)